MFGDERFSDDTRAALAEVVERKYTHDQLDHLFGRLGIYEDDWDERRQTKLRRVNQAIGILVGRDQNAPDTLRLARIVIEERLQGRIDKSLLEMQPDLRRLINGLKADGYELVEGELTQTSPDAAPVAEEMTALRRELKGLGWDVAENHYRQAIKNFTDGNFEACNAQLRAFLEDLIQQTAGQKNARGRDPKGSADKLVATRTLTSDEGMFLKGLIGISNTKGAHPGLSNEQEALFRLHVTTAIARYLLSL